CFFFFQAEDGIRDRNVTGVQTCALPIYSVVFTPNELASLIGGRIDWNVRNESYILRTFQSIPPPMSDAISFGVNTTESGPELVQIGRASCRERGEVSEVAGGLCTRGDG